MSYQVIARKWRPKTFQQLVGQNHVSQTLANALKNDRLHHALLFNGPRGTGKTSSARILAKSLRCPNAVEFQPCNECDTCIEISEGRNIDTIEIDGASNNGVDAIRELRDTVKYQPTSGRYKIYIIDEVHMLSTSAFNALLKTLEEPPAHVLFVLATTEVHKLPLTILSRVQRFDFRRIPTKQIAEHLEHICSRDEIKFQKEALWIIARQGGGSMRDSQSLLDQVTTFCEGSLTVENVINALGLTDRALLLETLENLIQKNQTSIISIIEKIFTSGYDPKLFTQDLLEEIRHITLLKTSDSKHLNQVIDLPDSEIDQLKKIMTDATEEDLHLLFDMTLKGVQDIARTEDTRLVLEMLLLRMVNAPRIASLKKILQGHGGSGNNSQPQTIQKTPVKKTAPQNPTPVKTETSSQKSISTSAEKSEVSVPYNPSKNFEENWLQFVQAVKDKDRLLGAKLENLCLVQKDAQSIQLAVPEKMSFLKDQVTKPEFLAGIKKFVQSIWKEHLNVEITKNTSQVKANPAKKIESEKKEEENNKLNEEAKKHPLTQSAQKIFNAEIGTVEKINK